MAHIKNLGGQTDLQWILNVDASVGPNCYNRWADVMLVQVFLNTLLAPLRLRDAKGREIKAYLGLDGLFGSKTTEAILGYQRNAQSRGLVVAADSRISSSSSTGWTPQNNQYTIVHINRDYRKIYGKMLSETDLPAELRKVIPPGPRS